MMSIWTRAILLLVAVLSGGLLTPAMSAEPSEEDTQLPLGRVELFVYIEDDEVRHEVLLPLRVLEIYMPVRRANDHVILVAEQEDAMDDIAALLGQQATLRIDGVVVQPQSERVVFFDKEIMDITGELPAAPIDTHDCLVGVIYRYPTLGPPAMVEMEWRLYHDILPTVRCTLFPYEQSQRVVLSQSQPSHTWRSRTRRQPVIVEAIAAETTAGGMFSRPRPVSPEFANSLAERLIRNVYRAFHYRREERIYDSLAQSLAGSLLADVYLNIRRGMEVAGEGGAFVRIDQVNIESFEGENLRADSFEGRMSWVVEGRIEHWGHIHERENLYVADIRVAKDEAVWRLVRLDVRDARRIGARLVAREVSEELQEVEE